MWKGFLSFRRYLPLKPSEFGLKTFGLSESLSGYLRTCIFYTGKANHFGPTPFSPPPKKTKTPKATEILIKLSATPQRLHLVVG